MAPIRANQITGTSSDFKMGVIKVIIIQMSDKIAKEHNLLITGMITDIIGCHDVTN